MESIRTNQSETLGKLFTAIALAQPKIVAPLFDKEAKIPMRKGGMFQFKYASLNAVQSALKGPLSENGLCYMQFPSAKGNIVRIETMVGHSSGEWISRTFELTAASPDTKEVGSCVTYGKRYSLAAVFNLTADEDQDAAPVSTAYNGSPDQKRWLSDKLKELGVPNDQMVVYHKTMMDGKMAASDNSIMALIEEARK